VPGAISTPIGRSRMRGLVHCLRFGDDPVVICQDDRPKRHNEEISIIGGATAVPIVMLPYRDQLHQVLTCALLSVRSNWSPARRP
jgi:hypothetical protein